MSQVVIEYPVLNSPFAVKVINYLGDQVLRVLAVS